MTAPTRRPRVAIVGTFDVANYGDLLFPLLAQQALSRRLGPIELVAFSYHAREAGTWPYDVVSLADFAAQVASFDVVIVGGGHLVRFDKHVAPGYAPPTDEIHHPTGYWLGPTLAARAASVPVVWNAPSASHDTPAWARPLLRLALMATDYLSVRDSISRDELVSVAPEARISVVPDSAFGLAALLDASDARERRASIASTLARPYLVCHAHGEAFAAIDAVRTCARFDAHDLVEVAIGPGIGDRVGHLVPTRAREHQLEHWDHPLEITTLVEGAAGVVTRSLHLAVTALALGRPVLVPDLPAGTKYALLARSPRVFVGDGPEVLAAFADATRVVEVCPVASESVAELERHWDHVAHIAGTPSRARHVPHALIAHWLALPIAFEDASANASAIVGANAELVRLDAGRLALEERAAGLATALADATEAHALELGRAQTHAQACELALQRAERAALTCERLATIARLEHARLEQASPEWLGRSLDRMTRLRQRLARESARTRDVRLVAASGLFDATFYAARHPAAAAAAGGPIEHYLAAPVAEGTDPGPGFATWFYAQSNPDVAASGLHPLVHYLRWGAIEGRDPRPLNVPRSR